MNSKCSVQTLSIKASTLMMNFGHDTLIVSFRLAQRGESLPQKWMLSLKEKVLEFGRYILFVFVLHEGMSFTLVASRNKTWTRRTTALIVAQCLL